MTEATPRPWVSHRDQIVGNNGDTFSLGETMYGGQDTDAANAALIVRAVNNYDDALALLREAVEVMAFAVHAPAGAAVQTLQKQRARINAFLAKENSNG